MTALVVPAAAVVFMAAVWVGIRLRDARAVEFGERLSGGEG